MSPSRRTFLAGAAASLIARPSRAARDGVLEGAGDIVVTGDLGIVGTALRAHWKGRNVIGIDIKRGDDEDVANVLRPWLRRIKPGCIIVHLAIERGWDLLTSERCHAINQSIFRIAFAFGAERFVFASSQMVNARELRMGPLTYYAAEKLAMEAKLRAAAEQRAFSVRILRLGHFPGPDEIERPGDWTRLNETTLGWWFDEAINLADSSPLETWNVIGQTLPYGRGTK